MGRGATFVVLLVEDNRDHADLILRHMLRSSDARFQTEHVETLAGALEALTAKPRDAILLDLQLPDSRGIETLTRAVAQAGETAVVVLTSLADRNLATAALQEGAQDYLCKEDLGTEVLTRTIRYAVARKKIEERLKASLAERSKHAKILEDLNHRLQQQNHDLDNFNHMISHDLREPVRHLMLFSQRLLSSAGPELSEKACRDVQYIKAAAARMQSSVAGLQLLSQASRQEINRHPVPLESCVRSALLDLERLIDEQKASISVGWLPVVLADGDLLTVLFRNLLSNAIKYCLTPPCIETTVEETASGPICGVRDNGIGIDPHYGEQIFVPFQRLHTREEYGGGSGLGLAICHKVVERHGGRIWVESSPGQGSHFRFTLGKEALCKSQPLVSNPPRRRSADSKLPLRGTK